MKNEGMLYLGQCSVGNYNSFFYNIFFTSYPKQFLKYILILTYLHAEESKGFAR